jgi:hypothetical protein
MIPATNWYPTGGNWEGRVHLQGHYLHQLCVAVNEREKLLKLPISWWAWASGKQFPTPADFGDVPDGFAQRLGVARNVTCNILRQKIEALCSRFVDPVTGDPLNFATVLLNAGYGPQWIDPARIADIRPLYQIRNVLDQLRFLKQTIQMGALSGQQRRTLQWSVEFPEQYVPGPQALGVCWQRALELDPPEDFGAAWIGFNASFEHESFQGEGWHFQTFFYEKVAIGFYRPVQIAPGNPHRAKVSFWAQYGLTASPLLYPNMPRHIGAYQFTINGETFRLDTAPYAGEVDEVNHVVTKPAFYRWEPFRTYWFDDPVMLRGEGGRVYGEPVFDMQLTIPSAPTWYPPFNNTPGYEGNWNYGFNVYYHDPILITRLDLGDHLTYG